MKKKLSKLEKEFSKLSPIDKMYNQEAIDIERFVGYSKMIKEREKSKKK